MLDIRQSDNRVPLTASRGRTSGVASSAWRTRYLRLFLNVAKQPPSACLYGFRNVESW